MKKILTGSFMALLLIAFLAACSTGAGGGGTPGAAKGPAPVALGTAGNYVILAKDAITNVPTSVITGDIGISPTAASAITGFNGGLALDAGGLFSTTGEVVGKVYAASYGGATAVSLTSGVNDMLTAYTDAAGRVSPDFLNLGSGEIGGLTLVPGLYKWTTGVTISNDVTLNGGASDTWIFQISGTLTEAVAKKVILTGGAQAKNIVWQVAGGATLGGTTQFKGILLSFSAITVNAGSAITGRLLAKTAASVSSSTVTQP